MPKGETTINILLAAFTLGGAVLLSGIFGVLPSLPPSALVSAGAAIMFITAIWICFILLSRRRAETSSSHGASTRQTASNGGANVSIHARDKVSVVIGRGESEPQETQQGRSQRTPIIEFRELAMRKGWASDIFTITGRNDPWTFVTILRQAAVDGKIRLWGRKYSYEIPEDIGASVPLTKIPPIHFEEFSFDPVGFFTADSNYGIFTDKIAELRSDMRGKIYRDLYIDWNQGVDWLNDEGAPKDLGPLPPAPEPDWFWPAEAINKFVPSDLLAKWEAAKATSREADGVEVDTYHQLIAAQKRTPKNTSSISMPEWRAVIRLREKLRIARDVSLPAESEKRKLERAVLEELHDQLRRGELIARGHLMPVTGGKATKIDKSVWTYLRINVEQKKATGPSVEYIGVEIRDGSI